MKKQFLSVVALEFLLVACLSNEQHQEEKIRRDIERSEREQVREDHERSSFGPNESSVTE